ncbi:MAG TPA: hypothetical protein VFB60_02490 [Ktedonobacteraceae bacterium]|nr:hypothetical protein [Ktedonobacteraceae bacterium]
MATTPLRGFECPDHILIPSNEADLLVAIETITNRRQYLNIRKSILSIQHKLSVAMYQAALVYRLNPNHFKLFEMFRDPTSRDIKSSDISYKICAYSMEDIDEYLLALAFFIETFAATIFSLLDVSGSLINQLYMLNINEEEVSFHAALLQLQKQARITPSDDIFRLLCSYSLSSRVSGYTSTIPLRNITWLKPIKEIRNRTTHRPITDVCDFVSRGDVHSVHSREIPQTEFFLNQNVYPDKRLREFAKEVFDGIEEFVEDLYFYLKEAVQRSNSLPIY